MNNPAYAGTYAYGRRPERATLVNGSIQRVREPLDEPDSWEICLRNVHPERKTDRKDEVADPHEVTDNRASTLNAVNAAQEVRRESSSHRSG
ncbi:MAG: hypothetical protein MJD61_02670, partial [Proteobacteria bacterium]|nr:hypothetical protein [Pseudomonadota bacterium]